MSDFNQNNDKDLSFVDEVNTYVSTDTVTDIKSGIFGLFVNLYNSYSLEYGPVQGMQLSIQYLQNIIEQFKTILNDTESNDL